MRAGVFNFRGDTTKQALQDIADEETKGDGEEEALAQHNRHDRSVEENTRRDDSWREDT